MVSHVSRRRFGASLVTHGSSSHGGEGALTLDAERVETRLQSILAVTRSRLTGNQASGPKFGTSRSTLGMPTLGKDDQLILQAYQSISMHLRIWETYCFSKTRLC